MEKWVPVTIDPYSDAYEVGSLGNVRSKDRSYEHGRLQRGRVLSKVLVRGYHYVLLQSKPHKRMTRVHHLVALAFIGKPPGKIAQNGWQVNHKNGDKLDNRPENLEWVTQAQNRQHAIDAGRFWSRGSKQHLAVLNERLVLQARKRFANGETVMEIAKSIGANWCTIKAAVTGKTWKHVHFPSRPTG